MARQTVRRHVDTLLEAGLLVALPGAAKRDGPSYVVNQRALFLAALEMEKISALAPLAPTDEERTMMDVSLPRQESNGPHLVLLNGPYKGRPVPLRTTGGEQRWAIGRSPDNDVALDFDPFASARAAIIETQGAGFTFRRVAPPSRPINLNFVEALPHRTLPLADKDVIGIGQTLLWLRC